MLKCSQEACVEKSNDRGNDTNEKIITGPGQPVRYSVTGMTCAACQAHVEKAVSGVPGVTSCSVSLLTASMSAYGSADPAGVIEAVRRAGYDASVSD